MNTGASAFLPREDPPEQSAAEGAEAPAPAASNDEQLSSLLQATLNASEGGGEERPHPATAGSKQDMDLQEKLNAAFMNSKESRKQGSTSGSAPTEISLANAGLDSSWKPQYHGRLRSFVEQKGFGFIDCQETYSKYGRDVFVHRMQIQESGVMVGQQVYFDVELNNKGHPQARNIVAVNPNEGMQWDPYNSWGYGNMSYANYGGYNGYGGGGGGGCGYGGGTGSGGGAAGNNSRTQFEVPTSDTLPQFEEELRKCNTEQAINDIIELYGQHFTKGHVVAALYQLGLCRQKPRGDSEPKNVGLATALLERVLQVDSKTLTSDEASRVVWALAALEEVQGNARAAEYAMELGGQARARLSEFNPAQMATLVGALSRIVRKPQDDALVADITTKFSEYASGNGSFPKFPQQDLKIWTQFLIEASQTPQQNATPQMQVQGGGQGNMGMMPCQGQGMQQGVNPLIEGHMQHMQSLQNVGNMMRNQQQQQAMQGCGGGGRGCIGPGSGGPGLSQQQSEQFRHIQMQQLQSQRQGAGCGGCQNMAPVHQNMGGMDMSMKGMMGMQQGMTGCKGGNFGMQSQGKGMPQGMGMSPNPMGGMKGGMPPQGKGPVGGMRGDNSSLLQGANMKAGLPGMVGNKGGVGFKGDPLSDSPGKGMSKGKGGGDKGGFGGKGKSKDGKDGSKGKGKSKDGNGKDKGGSPAPPPPFPQPFDSPHSPNPLDD